ncbi:hypothetical protein D3C81_892010 [compost metagenome]
MKCMRTLPCPKPLPAARVFAAARRTRRRRMTCRGWPRGYRAGACWPCAARPAPPACATWPPARWPPRPAGHDARAAAPAAAPARGRLVPGAAPRAGARAGRGRRSPAQPVAAAGVLPHPAARASRRGAAYRQLDTAAPAPAPGHPAPPARRWHLAAPRAAAPATRTGAARRRRTPSPQAAGAARAQRAAPLVPQLARTGLLPRQAAAPPAPGAAAGHRLEARGTAPRVAVAHLVRRAVADAGAAVAGRRRGHSAVHHAAAAAGPVPAGRADHPRPAGAAAHPGTRRHADHGRAVGIDGRPLYLVAYHDHAAVRERAGGRLRLPAVRGRGLYLDRAVPGLRADYLAAQPPAGATASRYRELAYCRRADPHLQRAVAGAAADRLCRAGAGLAAGKAAHLYPRRRCPRRSARLCARRRRGLPGAHRARARQGGQYQFGAAAHAGRVRRDLRLRPHAGAFLPADDDGRVYRRPQMRDGADAAPLLLAGPVRAQLRHLPPRAQ